jgi:hypothetical protein
MVKNFCKCHNVPPPAQQLKKELLEETQL